MINLIKKRNPSRVVSISGLKDLHFLHQPEPDVIELIANDQYNQEITSPEFCADKTTSNVMQCPGWTTWVKAQTKAVLGISLDAFTATTTFSAPSNPFSTFPVFSSLLIDPVNNHFQYIPSSMNPTRQIHITNSHNFYKCTHMKTVTIT